ncbi:hypothetical protein [Cereibacter sphaeroides]|uniref:hypothetical protein n=1 Tax=Cereibacter sphaeroides TaxID=1063 RepID=UPI001E652F3F|nr:hypothetical protein [Cereibacter sphaeroides]
MRSDLRRLSGLTLSLFLAGGLALAQGSAPTPQDLEALNYYVSNGDSRAADAELRRLRAQFPDWDVPSDLTTLGQQRSPAAEIDRIYRQIAAGDLTEARQAMDETSRNFPGWTPPPEMERLLATAEAQAAFDAAASAGNAGAAIEIARRTPAILRCDRVNNAWRLAELQAAAGQKAAALQSYRGVIASCSGLSEVTATLEKAEAVASDAELVELFRLANAQLPGSGPALKALETRLRAGRGDTAPEASAPAAAATGGAKRTPGRTAVAEADLPAAGRRGARALRAWRAAAEGRGCPRSARRRNAATGGAAPASPAAPPAPTCSTSGPGASIISTGRSRRWRLSSLPPRGASGRRSRGTRASERRSRCWR